MKKCLLLIDVQNDFCHQNGSNKKVLSQTPDIISNKIDEFKSNIDGIVLVLDSHYPMDISHSNYWIDFEGNHPADGIIISRKEAKGRKYQVYSPYIPKDVLEEKQKMAVEYLENLESIGKQHIIQPPHCLFGGWGHAVYGSVFNSVLDWSKEKGMDHQVVLKGLHQHSEHFGAFEAAVPNPNIPETMLNQGILQYLDNFDNVYIFGPKESLMYTLIQLTECADFLNAPDIIDRYVVISDDEDVKEYCNKIKYRTTTLNDLKI